MKKHAIQRSPMGSKTRNQDVVHELEKVSRAGRGMCHSAHTRSDSHPRNAGTYSRVLAQYVREKGTISLMDALRKMSLMPAEMLERSTPDARRKGRLQEGADADIVVFDAATISDRSTFAKPMEPSVGVRYLLVGGTVVVDEGKIVPDVFPGLALLGPGKRSVLHD